jgi:peptidoglycan/LPS O-acetylase OafA/YrhL
MVCGGLGISNIDWARFGYATITLLPALGIHMLSAIAGKKTGWLVKTAYATCAAFVIFYVVGQGALNGHTCYSNYAVFDTLHSSNILFGLYYYGWMFIGIYLAFIWSNELPRHRHALQAMAMGYAAFILPTTAFNIIDPSTTRGIPSIMCGFAAIFAIILVTKVLPNSCHEKNESFFDSVVNKLRLKI